MTLQKLYGVWQVDRRGPCYYLERMGGRAESWFDAKKPAIQPAEWSRSLSPRRHHDDDKHWSFYTLGSIAAFRGTPWFHRPIGGRQNLNVKYLALLVLVSALALSCSGAAETRPPLTPLVSPPPPAINEGKAILLAYEHLDDIVVGGNVTAKFGTSVNGPGFWSVVFEDISVTRRQLEEIGWHEGLDTHFGPGDSYNQLTVIVNAETGSVIRKEAYIKGPVLAPSPPVLPIGPVDMEEATAIAHGIVPASVVARSQIEVSIGVGLTIPEKSSASWLVYYIVDVDARELGWKKERNTQLDPLKPGEKYFQLAVEVDANSGKVIRKAAFAKNTQ